MPISFERNICCNLEETISREWLITNGLGGYAAGTVAGTLTRMQQGLLVASTADEAVPQLLVAKIDEEVLFDQRTYYLGTNEYQDGTLNPAGFVHLEAFRLEEGLPVFTYRLGGIDGVMLEKRIWMPHGQNTTIIQYRVLRASMPSSNSRNSDDYGAGRGRSRYNGYLRASDPLEHAPLPLTLTLLPLVAQRPYDQPQYGNDNWHFQVQSLQQDTDLDGDEQDLSLPRGVAGCSIRARKDSRAYHILAVGHPESQTQFIPTGVWYWRFLRRHNQAAHLPPTDDLYLPGVVRTRLWADKDATLTIVVTAEDLSSLPLSQKQLGHSYEQTLDYQRNLFQGQRYFGDGGGSIQTLPVLPLKDAVNTPVKSEEFLQLLYQASDRLLSRQTLPFHGRSNGPDFFFQTAEYISAIIPGYYHMASHTRETLIALPGLTLATDRQNEAQRLLRSIARHFRQGLLPDRLPTTQRPMLEDADYHNVDVALWYFYALDKYLAITRDYEILDELYMRLTDCITHYVNGTRHGIRVDPADGLLSIDAPKHALTWMGGSDEGSAATPRTGKPVEVNALWYHALRLMDEWSQLLYQRNHINHLTTGYAELSERCLQSFNQRFWYGEGNYLYDVIDGPDGNDSSLRPNQLFAFSLRYPVLDVSKRVAVLEVIARQLVTPYGLRTLAPDDKAYRGHLPLDHTELQQAQHQGAAWPWLLGPYIDALLQSGLETSTVQAEERVRNSAAEHYKELIWRRGLEILEPLREQMQQHMLGSIGSVYDGDAPYQIGPQLTSALSIGEILRTYKVLAHLGVQHFDHVISV